MWVQVCRGTNPDVRLEAVLVNRLLASMDLPFLECRGERLEEGAAKVPMRAPVLISGTARHQLRLQVWGSGDPAERARVEAAMVRPTCQTALAMLASAFTLPGISSLDALLSAYQSVLVKALAPGPDIGIVLKHEWTVV